MSDSEIHHLGAAYALDALDVRERAAFEAHLATCGICRDDVREMRETAADLAALTSAAPPAGLRSSVLDEIARTRQLSPLPGAVVRFADRRSRRLAVAVTAAAAAVVWGVVVLAVVDVAGLGVAGLVVPDEPVLGLVLFAVVLGFGADLAAGFSSASGRVASSRMRRGFISSKKASSSLNCEVNSLPRARTCLRNLATSRMAPGKRSGPSTMSAIMAIKKSSGSPIPKMLFIVFRPTYYV